VQPTIEEFVAVRGPALLRFALMLSGDRHTAEDLVQSVLAKAIPRWSRIVAMQLPERYLKKMVLNELLGWRRRRWRTEVPVATAATDRPVDDDTAAHASRSAAWHLLARLPRRQRAVLVLRYYEDLTDGEIAAVLGCRASTVRSQATRALATLRAALPNLERETLP
jgi:RNA polymerase sigma-70 factor (sigma-E family)